MYFKLLLNLFITISALNYCSAGENDTTLNIQQRYTHNTEFINDIMLPVASLQLAGLCMLTCDLGIAFEKGSLDKSVIVSSLKKLLKGASLKSDEALFAQILCFCGLSYGIFNGFRAAYEFKLPIILCFFAGGVSTISGLIAGLPIAYLSRLKFNLPLI